MITFSKIRVVYEDHWRLTSTKSTLHSLSSVVQTTRVEINLRFIWSLTGRRNQWKVLRVDFKCRVIFTRVRA